MPKGTFEPLPTPSTKSISVEDLLASYMPKERKPKGEGRPKNELRKKVDEFIAGGNAIMEMAFTTEDDAARARINVYNYVLKLNGDKPNTEAIWVSPRPRGGRSFTLANLALINDAQAKAAIVHRMEVGQQAAVKRAEAMAKPAPAKKAAAKKTAAK